MIERTWKRVVVGVAVLVLGTAGVLLWRSHRESAAKAALSAEIRAERAARARPADPVPTAEELETADQYRVAASRLTVTDFLIGEFEGADEAMDAVPWAAVPEPVARMLAANAEALALADTAIARGACRFADTSHQSRVSECTMLLRLLSARGHAALAGGDPIAAAEDVRRLLRVGRDLAAAPSAASAEDVIPWPAMHLLRAEQNAAELLSALATAPGLPPEAGPALAAAAKAPWGSADANRRSVDFHEESSDAITLQMLAPDAEAWLEKRRAMADEIEDLMTVKPTNRSILDKAKDRVRKAMRPGIEVPTAASAREYRAMRAPVVAALRRRDMTALAPGGPHDETGALFGFLGPRWFRNAVSKEARIAVARAAATIRAFQLREGRPPRALEDLVPSVFPEVLLDPLDGKPLVYEVEGDAWRVASRVWRERGLGEDEMPGLPPPVEVRFPRAPK